MAREQRPETKARTIPASDRLNHVLLMYGRHLFCGGGFSDWPPARASPRGSTTLSVKAQQRPNATFHGWQQSAAEHHHDGGGSDRCLPRDDGPASPNSPPAARRLASCGLRGAEVSAKALVAGLVGVRASSAAASAPMDPRGGSAAAKS